MAAILTCKDLAVLQELIRFGFSDKEWSVRRAAIERAVEGSNANEALKLWLDINPWDCCIAVYELSWNCHQKVAEYISKSIESGRLPMFKTYASLENCRSLPQDVALSWLEDHAWLPRMTAFFSAQKETITEGIIRRGLYDTNENVRTVAAQCLEQKAISDSTVITWAADSNQYVRAAALTLCAKRPSLFEVVLAGMLDNSAIVRMNANQAYSELCRFFRLKNEPGCNVVEGERTERFYENIGKFLYFQLASSERQALFQDALNNELPDSLLRLGLQDSDSPVRKTALMNCKQQRFCQIHRSFEPPKEVYIQCIHGVVAVASIPSDACIWGIQDGVCRTSKAQIQRIDGELLGFPVGISQYDKATVFTPGCELENTPKGTPFHSLDFFEPGGIYFTCSRELMDV